MLTTDQIAQVRAAAGAPPTPTAPSAPTAGVSLSQKTAVQAPKAAMPTDTHAENATFPATGNESPLAIAGKTIGNIPSSAINFGKSTIDFFNPLNTVKTAQNLGTSAGEALDEGNAGTLAKDTIAGLPKAAYDTVVPQFLHHVFSGDLGKAAATLENDPVGQLAPLIMVARGAAQKAGRGAEFDTAMSTIAKPVTATAKGAANAVGNVAAQTLGATTGVGASTIKVAAEGTPEFTQAMRGHINPEDVVNSAKNVVKNIKENRSSSYVEDLKKVGEDKTSHDITSVVDEVPKQLKNFGIKVGEDGELDFSRSSIANSKSARADVQGVYDTVKDWGKQRGDRTGIGLDTLKKQLGDFYSESGQARAFVQAIKSKVSNILDTKIPGYKEMTGKYQKASALLEDIKSATAIGGKANADTVFTKLTTAMKGDKEFRLEVLKEMEAAGDPRLMDKIAGANMQSLIPKGLVGRGIDVVTAYQLLQGSFSPQFLPMLLATSPRVVGEFVRTLGLGASKTKSVLDAINKLPSKFDLTPVQSDEASMAPSAKQTANSVPKNANIDASIPQPSEKASQQGNPTEAPGSVPSPKDSMEGQRGFIKNPFASAKAGGYDVSAIATQIDNHFRSMETVLKEMPEDYIRANGGMKAQLAHFQTNVARDLQGHGMESEASAVDALNPLDYNTKESFLQAVYDASGTRPSHIVEETTTPTVQSFMDRLTGRGSQRGAIKNPFFKGDKTPDYSPELHDQVLEELHKVETRPATINGAPDFANTDTQFRLAQLQEKSNRVALNNAEIMEAYRLLKQSGIDPTKASKMGGEAPKEQPRIDKGNPGGGRFNKK